MKPEKDGKKEKISEKLGKKADEWIEKANDKMDEAAEKLHNSEAYRKADKSMEEATKKLFRNVGRWWGKL